MIDDPLRGCITDTKGLITSFLGICEITRADIDVFDNFVEPHFNEPGLISRASAENNITYVAICIPENSLELIAFCSFKEEKEHILLENFCTAEFGGLTARAFLIDSITYLIRMRQKQIFLFVDSENVNFERVCHCFRTLMVTNNHGNRVRLLYECIKKKERGSWMKLVAHGTRMHWKGFPKTYTTAFTTIPQPEPAQEVEPEPVQATEPAQVVATVLPIVQATVTVQTPEKSTASSIELQNPFPKKKGIKRK